LLIVENEFYGSNSRRIDDIGFSTAGAAPCLFSGFYNGDAPGAVANLDPAQFFARFQIHYAAVVSLAKAFGVDAPFAV
jgi:hypothetical protein